MDLPKLPSAPRTPPSASSLAESPKAPSLPSRIPALPSRLARRSLDVSASSNPEHPKLQLNLPEEKNQPKSRSVPNSVASSPTDSVAEGKTKKRGRVTPKQLAQLEKLFALETCPSVERRKEISAALGMQERQLQIWFQNRRAKEKLRRGIPPRPRQRRQKLSLSVSPPPHPSSESESLPNTPPELTPGFDSELTARINEDLPVDIIPCDTLTIGTWKRQRSEAAEHSLVAYVSDSRRSLTWFIHNVGRSLKMVIPFHTIIHTELEDTSSSGTTGTTGISFILSDAPLFFFEASIVLPGTMKTIREWQGCHDWTEDLQATYCLRHTIQGPAIALHHFWETLQPKLASLERKANFRGRPTSWQQSPSSASEYSCPTPQGSISPLEMRKRLPPGEIFESYSPEASTHSSCSGPMGYYHPQTADSTFDDQPSPPSSDDQPSPMASGDDQPSPQATTPQYINLDGSPVTEVFEPTLMLTLPPIVPRIAHSHHDLSLVIPGDYQQHTPPSRSGFRAMDDCLTDQAFAATSKAVFPDPSPRTGTSFSNSSHTPIPVTTRYYTLDYGLATGCSSSTSSPLTATSHPSSSSTLPSAFTQPRFSNLSAGSLGSDPSSYFFLNTSTSNFGLSSNSPTLPPATFNQLDIDTAIPSSLTTASMSSFYPEATTATTSMDPGLNPELFQYLQQPLRQQQQQNQHQQPTLVAPTPFSASRYRLQEDWIAGLQWDQEHQHRHQHL